MSLLSLPPFFSKENRPPASELVRLGLSPANTLLSSGASFSASQLRYSYSKRAQPGDNPLFRGLLDQIKVDRGEEYEVVRFIDSWCKAVGCCAALDGPKIEPLLKAAPSSMVGRLELSWWIWNTLRSRAEAVHG